MKICFGQLNKKGGNTEKQRLPHPFATQLELFKRFSSNRLEKKINTLRWKSILKRDMDINQIM